MLSLRSARSHDLAAVLGMLKASNLPYEDITANHLDDFLVASDGETVAGIVGLERYGKDALLRSLAVRAEGRRAGLGSQLVAAVEAHAVHSGIADLYLLTTTAADFFLRRGYAHFTRPAAPAALQQSAEFSSLCPSQAVCMHKSLTT